MLWNLAQNCLINTNLRENFSHRNALTTPRPLRTIFIDKLQQTSRIPRKLIKIWTPSEINFGFSVSLARRQSFRWQTRFLRIISKRLLPWPPTSSLSDLIKSVSQNSNNKQTFPFSLITAHRLQLRELVNAHVDVPTVFGSRFNINLRLINICVEVSNP